MAFPRTVATLPRAAGVLPWAVGAPLDRRDSSVGRQSFNTDCRGRKISFPAVIYEPTFIRWAPRSGVPASLTTKDACTEHEIRLPEKTCRFTQFRLREKDNSYYKEIIKRLKS